MVTRFYDNTKIHACMPLVNTGMYGFGKDRFTHKNCAKAPDMGIYA